MKKTAKKTKKKTTAKNLAKRVARKPAAKRAASKKATKKVEAVPARYGTATAHLVVSPCKEALSFYEKAFGAKVYPAMEGPDGIVMHGEMKIGDSIIMVADEQPRTPADPTSLPRRTPKNAGATTGGVMLYVKNVDAFYERAVAAGAKPVMPPQDMFWGDRYGQVEDPYGHVWAIATHTRDLSTKQMMAAMAQARPSA